MVSSSSPHDRARSPTPLSQWRTKADSAAGKGKQRAYPNLSWVRERDGGLSKLSAADASGGDRASPPSGTSDAQRKASEIGRGTDGAGEQDESGQRQRTVEVGEQGEVVQVVDEEMQDEPPAQSAASMIPVKTEEIPATIPSPTRGEQLSRRKRGSRSTIDVVSMSRSLRHPLNTENIVVWRTDRVFYWDARLSYCCTKGRRNAYGFYEHWSRRR